MGALNCPSQRVSVVTTPGCVCVCVLLPLNQQLLGKSKRPCFRLSTSRVDAKIFNRDAFCYRSVGQQRDGGPGPEGDRDH